MSIFETEAKSILRKHKRVDSWFVSRYGMNLYRGCAHNCAYCDGRAEDYRVAGEFGQDVTVKTNALEVLARELDPKRKRVPFKRGYIVLGGGVGDSYQPIEKKYGLTRQVLELLRNTDFPVHILTKSTLVERDIDLLKQINARTRVIVSMSFSSVIDEQSACYEPGTPPASERLQTLARLRREGIACGMFLMPVIPFVTDSPEMLDAAARQAVASGVSFVIWGGMTLKEGRQKEHFMNLLERRRPELAQEYQMIYRGGRWGEATKEYYDSLNEMFNIIAKRYRLPRRIPPALYRGLVDENDLVVIMLEHIDYLLKAEGQTSPYGYAAYSVSQLKEPLSSRRGEIRNLKGVGKTTENIIQEILDTGSSSYLNKLAGNAR